MHRLKKWRPLRPAFLHKEQDLTCGLVQGFWKRLQGPLGGGCPSFDAVQRKLLALALLLVYSKRESNAWVIWGLRDARDLDRSSVLQRYLTKLRRSGCTNLRHVSTTRLSRVGDISSWELGTSPWCEIISICQTTVWDNFNLPKINYLRYRTSDVDRDPRGAQQGQVWCYWSRGSERRLIGNRSEGESLARWSSWRLSS